MHTFYLNGDKNLPQHCLVLTLHLKTLQSVSNNQIRNGSETPHRSCYIPTFHYSTQPPCVRVADYQIWPKIIQNFSLIFKHHLHLSFQKTVLKRGCYLWHPARHPLLWLWRASQKERCTLLADAAAKHLCEKISPLPAETLYHSLVGTLCCEIHHRAEWYSHIYQLSRLRFNSIPLQRFTEMWVKNGETLHITHSQENKQRLNQKRLFS